MNIRPASHRLRWTASTLALAILAGACGSDSRVTDLSSEATDDLREVLSVALEDEYHAEAVYAGVLGDFGQVLPFSNIVDAELRHSTAIARLYEIRGWTVPESQWTPENVAHFGTLQEACAVGVTGEIANVAVYDELLAEPGLPSDVVRVFSSNREASLERHLPAFQTCAGY
jgi:hypothetical protein